MNLQTQSEEPVPIYEIVHLRRALDRLEGIGETKSHTIDSLKRVVLLQIAELEAVQSSDEGQVRSQDMTRVLSPHVILRA
jgi:hypothetical protein